jgi:hypothetical protein
VHLFGTEACLRSTSDKLPLDFASIQSAMKLFFTLNTRQISMGVAKMFRVEIQSEFKGRLLRMRPLASLQKIKIIMILFQLFIILLS